MSRRGGQQELIPRSRLNANNKQWAAHSRQALFYCLLPSADCLLKSLKSIAETTLANITAFEQGQEHTIIPGCDRDEVMQRLMFGADTRGINPHFPLRAVG